MRPASAQLLDRLAHDERCLRVQRGRRFVEEHDRGIVEERAADRQLLLHALAERARHVVAPVPEPEQAQVVLDPLGTGRGVQSIEPAEEVEVRGRRQLVVQAWGLGQDADPGTNVIGPFPDVEAFDRRPCPRSAR